MVVDQFIRTPRIISAEEKICLIPGATELSPNQPSAA